MKKFIQSKFVNDYGSIFVLLLLVMYYTWNTRDTIHHPTDADAGRKMARQILAQHKKPAIWIVTRDTEADEKFAQAAKEELEKGDATVLDEWPGDPRGFRQALNEALEINGHIDAIATHYYCARWNPMRPAQLQALGTQAQVHTPESYRWPSFLTRDNLRNILNQNADIAIIAIGMTLVILIAGIDLSVGSLMALASVSTAIIIQRYMGGAATSTFGLALGCLMVLGIGAMSGGFTGALVTGFRVPPFVVTLGLMMALEGAAYIATVRFKNTLADEAKAEGGEIIAATPETIDIQSAAFDSLGKVEWLGIHYSAWLMLALFLIVHIMMTRTTFGRYIYAVGGNPEAARLSGVPVTWVIIIVYILCGVLAAVAGIVDASQRGGRPAAGDQYELRAIAAVVVGGTSLFGGVGRILGTLIGVMIIAVISNGLYMANFDSYEKMVVYGLLIIVAVLLDQLKKRGLKQAN